VDWVEGVRRFMSICQFCFHVLVRRWGGIKELGYDIRHRAFVRAETKAGGSVYQLYPN
jgi:hypothetical protein